jgi:hypothetical protein
VLVRLIKAVNYRAVDVDDCHNLGRKYRISFKGTFIARRAREAQYAYLPINQNGHNDLTLRVAVARNVTREEFNVWHKLCLGALSCYTADSATESNDLTGNFALERSKNQLGLLARCCP